MIQILKNFSSSLIFSSKIRAFNWIGIMSQSTICTHNGVFHCDDVLACYLLKQLPEFKDSKIIRTRDQNVIDSCDIVVDVGGVYDHDKKRYDHHQRGFTHTLNSLDPKKTFNIKLSSAGLVYHHYGRRIINQFLGLTEDSGDDNRIEVLFDKIYESFIQEVDAIDNGIEICDGPQKYTINSDLSSRVSHIIPAWDEEGSEEILYEKFLEAIKMVGGELGDRMKYYGKHWYPAKMYVKEAIVNRHSVHSTGAIIDLSPYGGVPWKEHLFTIEKELGIEGSIKFAVSLSIDKKWRIIGVPIQPKSFELRLPLHSDWRGLRNDELSKISGIPGCVFVHASGFIGGGESKETCIRLAEKTIKETSKED